MVAWSQLFRQLIVEAEPRLPQGRRPPVAIGLAGAGHFPLDRPCSVLFCLVAWGSRNDAYSHTDGKKLVAEAAAKESSGLIEGIATARREQATAIEEVPKAVCTLDEMTQDNAFDG
ncbi:MAG: hypothetical protein ABI216_08855 [Devosia sp.]